MSSWRAVLKTEGQICEYSLEERRQGIQGRSLKRIRVGDPALGFLLNCLHNSPHVTMSNRKGSKVWAMSNLEGNQHTIGTLEWVDGWKASGWAAEHLIFLASQQPMMSIKRGDPFLKPRVRRLLLQRGPLCHFCDDAMPLGNITIEHWLARSLGGDNRPDNLKLAHRRCNELAGSLSIKQKNRLRHELKMNAKLRATLLHP